MRDLSVAIAILGIAFSLAYCGVSIHRENAEAQAAERKFCSEAGGRWTYGWGPSWCEYQVAP